MKNYLKKIILSICMLTLLNSCTRSLEFDLVIDKISEADKQMIIKEYVIPNYKNDESSDKQIDEFVHKIVNSTENESYMRIWFKFFKANEKTDLKAIKERKSQLGENEEKLLAYYMFYQGKVVEKGFARFEEKKDPEVIDKNAPVVTPED